RLKVRRQNRGLMPSVGELAILAQPKLVGQLRAALRQLHGHGFASGQCHAVRGELFPPPIVRAETCDNSEWQSASAASARTTPGCSLPGRTPWWTSGRVDLRLVAAPAPASWPRSPLTMELHPL